MRNVTATGIYMLIFSATRNTSYSATENRRGVLARTNLLQKGNLPRNIVSNYFCTRNLKQPPKSFTQTSSISENISLCFRTDSETNLFGPKTYLIRKDWEGGLGKKAYLPGQFFQSWPCLPSKFGRLGVLPMMYCQ